MLHLEPKDESQIWMIMRRTLFFSSLSIQKLKMIQIFEFFFAFCENSCVENRGEVEGVVSSPMGCRCERKDLFSTYSLV